MDLGSDILPRECTPADMVAEAGKVLVNHVTVEQEARSFSVGSSQKRQTNLATAITTWIQTGPREYTRIHEDGLPPEILHKNHFYKLRIITTF
jgi:hypothetical protein